MHEVVRRWWVAGVSVGVSVNVTMMTTAHLFGAVAKTVVVVAGSTAEPAACSTNNSSVLQRVTASYNVSQRVTACHSELQRVVARHSVLQRVTACYNVSQRVTTCYNVS